MDAFISYSMIDAATAVRLERLLANEGVTVWIDRDNIRGGGVLVAELQTALKGSKNLVLLWSSASAQSEWVMTEWTSVVNLNHQKGIAEKKGLIPCLLDDTPLELFLLRYLYCDFRRSFDDGAACLLKALKSPVVDRTPAPTPWTPSQFVEEILARQSEILGVLGSGNVARAQQLQDGVKPTVDAALRANPSDRYLLALAGYDKKNQYMIRHWEEIQTGQSPGDPALDEAAALFFKVLSVHPDDPSALNGLGSVFILRRDLDAAEFYITRALERSREENVTYLAAEEDLELVRRLRRSGSKKRPSSGSRKRAPRRT
jgi:tetratricopeptide (TPR) repeat protein